MSEKGRKTESDTEVLNNLVQGATVCRNNARRLIDDAETLFSKGSYLSCFLLSELALEEIAKGFKLLEKHIEKKEFSRLEWKDWTGSAKAHAKKLKFAHEVDDEWLKKVLKYHRISYKEFLNGFLKNFPWAKNIDDYWEKTSTAYYDFRLDSLYVDYDFEKKQWVDPTESEIAKEPNLSFQGLVWAKHLLSIYEDALQRRERISHE